MQLESSVVLSNNLLFEEEQGDYHLSGLVIIPLVGKGTAPYKVRTILDSGSGTNFISECILPHVKHEYLATKCLTVTGINSSEKRSHKLVRIFISNTNSFSIKCYTLPSILEFSVNKASYNKIQEECSDIPEYKDPLKVSADHGKGIGLVLGPGTIRDISVSEPKAYKAYLVDFTMFGPAVSGRLENPIQTQLYSAFMNFEEALVSEEVLVSAESGIDDKIQLLEDLKFLSDKEILGVKPKELHYEDKLCIEKFKQEVKYDSINKKYIVSLPFNNKKNLLPTNEYQALIRTDFTKSLSKGSKLWPFVFISNR